jgi:hypothetical protein
MKLEKVRRVLAFRQTPFLKQYIDICTELRKKSKTEFGKSLWKLFCNSVFGKTIESSRNYLNVKICSDYAKCEKLMASPNFSNMKIISENVVLVFSKQPTATLNKPYAVGFSILEKAKHFMYEKYYDVIKPNLGNSEIVMSDTDSFVIAVHTEFQTNNLQKISHIIDYSNYDKDHKLYNDSNENKLGFFKDELKGNKMRRICGLKAKSYIGEINNEKTKEVFYQVKAKGVNKEARSKLTFQNYLGCLKKVCHFRATQHQIRSKSHVLQTVGVDKICFTSMDDKRWLLDCGLHSLPYGSKVIKTLKKNVCPKCEIYNPLK